MRPWQVSALFLKYLVDLARPYFSGEGRPVNAVITVPANFSYQQRSETLRAAKEAGIDVLTLLNEPTAAAIAVVDARPDLTLGTFLVFDFGGGTLDVSIGRAVGDEITVFATSGDTSLGGRDFDERLVEFCAKAFEQQHGISLSRDPDGPEWMTEAVERLSEACEKAKVRLTQATRASVAVDYIYERKSLRQDVSRAQFEDMCKDLFDRCLAPVSAALESAKLEPRDIDHVILVGGISLMPKVQQQLTTFSASSRLLGSIPGKRL
jgi:molecular chaperone DnaK (HSP70)